MIVMIVLTVMRIFLSVNRLLPMTTRHQKKDHPATAMMDLWINFVKDRWLAEEKDHAALAAVAVAAAALAMMSSMKLTAHSKIFAIKFAIFNTAKRLKMLALPVSKPDLLTTE